jgi:hypothetical protein
MNQIVRTIKTHPALAISAVAIWGVFEFVALRRSQAILREQNRA